MSTPRPITILIAALGGEGGGVLTQWIVSAAAHAGFPVQITSIPGVAQRTGATTYYIEILPVPSRELGGKRPVLALTPGVGDIDVAVASELLEAGRTVANGFVTPRANACDRIAQPLLCHGRKDRHGRRALRSGQADQDHQGQCERRSAHRHGCARQAERLDHQRGDARRHCRLRAAAAQARTVRGRNPRRRQIGRQQLARLPCRI